MIRIPIIPDVNNSIEEIQKIKDFLKTIGTAEKIELLPYHVMGENKYRRIRVRAIVRNCPKTALFP